MSDTASKTRTCPGERIAAVSRSAYSRGVRKPRAWAPGAVYHLSPNGNGGRAVFLDDVDRESFLGIATEVAAAYEVVVIGYCLMGNHLHLLVVSGGPGLSRFMQVGLGRHSRWINRRHGSAGSVFEPRFHVTPVLGDPHLWKVASYIDLNPVKDGFVERPEEWPWSSYRAHVGLEEPAPLLSLDAFHTYLDPGAYRRFVEEELRCLTPRPSPSSRSPLDGV